MNVVVVGTGYVGLIQGVGLAELGHKVVCIDIAEEKIKMLRKAQSPIYEPGLNELLSKNIDTKNIQFDTSLTKHMATADVVFIAVGTPSGDDGRADLRFVNAVVDEIKKSITQPIVVTKSTVPLGTNANMQKHLRDHTSKNWHVVSNPEFLREGSAIHDFFNPDRIVLGGDKEACAVVKKLYTKLSAPVLITNLETAEMIKYASNSFLATQISFINYISQICEQAGANVKDVSRGMRYDKRIGEHAFLRAGLGYGGSCFPKDVRALMRISEDKQIDHSLLHTVEGVNQSQRTHFLDRIYKKIGNVQGLTIAVWGIAFKPDTDDVRESPAVDIIKSLVDKKAQVIAYDPIVTDKLWHLPQVKHASSALEACKDAHALIIVTEWKEFHDIKPSQLVSIMKTPLIFDGRNIYDEQDLTDFTGEYISIGR